MPRERILTIVNRSHLREVQTQLQGQPPATIIVQPCGRETVNGILLPLLHIYRRDPHAIVGIFPSDHFIWDEARFMRYVAGAFQFAGMHSNSVVLLGSHPSSIEPGYGWIEKNEPVQNPWNLTVYRIRRFWEKPDLSTSQILFRDGCVCNTLVMAASASSLLSIFRATVPETFTILNDITKVTDTAEKENLLNLIYPALPSLNFSKAVLETCTEYLHVLEMRDVYWSDWGEECRVLRDVERLHLKIHGSIEPGSPERKAENGPGQFQGTRLP